MPMAPPVFRPLGTQTPQQRKAQADRRRVSSDTTRIYGRARQERNRMVLTEEPICRHCGRAASVEVDHIIPLSEGGAEDRSNLQGLCRDCHGAKTAAERARGRGVTLGLRARTASRAANFHVSKTGSD